MKSGTNLNVGESFIFTISRYYYDVRRQVAFFGYELVGFLKGRRNMVNYIHVG